MGLSNSGSSNLGSVGNLGNTGIAGNTGITGGGGQSNNFSNTYNSALPPGISYNQIPPGQDDKYILKTQVVPPVCPTCNTCKIVDAGSSCSNKKKGGGNNTDNTDYDSDYDYNSGGNSSGNVGFGSYSNYSSSGGAKPITDFFHNSYN